MGRLSFFLFFILSLNVFFPKKSTESVILNNDIVISTDRWEEINIRIYNQFDPEKPNIIALLRPAGYAHKNNMTLGNKRQWLEKMGLPTEMSATITVKALSCNDNIALNKMLRKSNHNMVTGIYVHDTDSVFTWFFKNRKGQKIIVHATENHPFYVKKTNKFIPLFQLTSVMKLTDDHHYDIHLICREGRIKNCGTPYRAGKITTVYNIEVNQEHQYFVTDQHIMSHNCNVNLFNSPGTTASSSSISSSSVSSSPVSSSPVSSLPECSPPAPDENTSSSIQAIPQSIGTVKTEHLSSANMLLIGTSVSGKIDIINSHSQATYRGLHQLDGTQQYKAVFVRTPSRGLIKYLPGKIPSGGEVYLLLDTKVSGMTYMKSTDGLLLKGVLTPLAAKSIIKKFYLDLSLGIRYGFNYNLVGLEGFSSGMRTLQSEALTASINGRDKNQLDRYFYVLQYELL